MIVSDSNNHRIQIFDVNGKVITTFGSEGTDFGQFKFPRQARGEIIKTKIDNNANNVLY